MASDPLIGTTVGGCMILEVLGQGGMGVIYKARQNSLDRIIALKLLAPHLANDINFVSRFQREARAIARVNHPNILAVYDVGDDQNVNYMIMELIDGRSLAELQNERRGALSWEESAEFIRQAAEGLEAAQAGGIIHRDIKPENLMVTKKGIIKVSDFGLAKEADASNTSIDAVMGTPAFMSPEQCDGKKVDGRSDIYSLGGTFFRLVTGRLPFDAETAMSMMYRHKHEALVPPIEIVSTIPKALSDIIVKMMAKKREQRFQTMTEVIEAIAKVRKPAAAAAQPATNVPKQASPNDPEPELPPAGTVPNLPMTRGNDDSGMFANRQPIPSAKSQRSMAVAPGSFTNIKDSAPQITVPAVIGMAQASGEDAFTLAARGDEMVNRGDRMGGLKVYRQALLLPALDGQTRGRIDDEVRKEIAVRKQAGENLYKRGMLLEATREYRVAIELDPADAAVRTSLRDLEAKLSLKRTVINDIRNAIASSSFDKAVKIWDGVPAELREEGIGKQIEQIRNDIIPSFKLAEQGESLARQGRLEEAMSTFEDALKINPTCEAARFGMNETQLKIQKIEFMLKEGFQHNLEQNYIQAVEAWKPILSLRPGHPQAIKGVVDACTAQAQQLRAYGDLEGALQALKSANETDPQNRGIRRSVDELTNLCDKEQALIDRAQDATARHKLGLAIRYWKEVQKINPPSKRAAQQIVVLGKQHSRRWILVFVILALMAAASGIGYKYYTEIETLESVGQALHAHPITQGDRLSAVMTTDGSLRDASERLSKGPFLFKGQERDTLLEQVNTQIEIEKARRLDLLGQTAEAIVEYQNVANRLKTSNRELYRIVAASMLLCKVRRKQEFAEEAVAARKWDMAYEDWSDIEGLLEKRSNTNAELDHAAQHAEQAASFVQKVMMGLSETKADNKQKAFLAAKKLLAGLDFPGCSEYLDKQIAGLGFDQNKFQENFDLAIKALSETPPDLKKANEYFRLARHFNSTDTSINPYLQYISDVVWCDEKGMSLYAYSPPTKEGLWGQHERKNAFCVDRYEWPNAANQTPRANVTWLDASNLCKTRGKMLCTTQQWTESCKGDDATKQYPYGRTPDPAKCNTEGKAVAASGANSGCKNALGLYDMSGNLAEWADSTDATSTDAAVMGGSYLTPTSQSGCEDSLPARKASAAANIGFRCCQVLPDLSAPNP